MLGPDFGKRGDERGVSEAAGECPAFEAIACLENLSRDDTGRPRDPGRERGLEVAREIEAVCDELDCFEPVFWSKPAISVLTRWNASSFERA